MIQGKPTNGSNRPSGASTTLAFEEAAEQPPATVAYEKAPTAPGRVPRATMSWGSRPPAAPDPAAQPAAPRLGGNDAPHPLAQTLAMNEPLPLPRGNTPAFDQTVAAADARSPVAEPVPDVRIAAAPSFASPSFASPGVASPGVASPGVAAAPRGDTVALGATTAADPMLSLSSSVPSGPVSGVRSSQAPSSLFRTTVLPRVELIGDEPKLVQESRARYEELKKLGEGGVGEVVKALDNDIQRPVAVKRLRPDMRTPGTLVRFVDEIRTVGKLEHPNIVPIHDVGVDDMGQYFFVMKYVDGETLENVIERLSAGDADYHRRYTFAKRIQIFQSVLEAIHYAHAQGIIHRDIKPANVMVGPYGEVMVMDWGLAKRIRGEGELPKSLRDAPASPEGEAGSARDRLFRTRVGTLLGTPAYMSPEQAKGAHDALDERSDIYSLTVLFYELMTLQHYLPEKQDLASMLKAIIEEEPVPAMTRSHPSQKAIPAEIGWFLRAGLEKDPTRRFASVEAMLRRLTDRSDGEICVQCPVTFTKNATNRWMRLLDNHPFLSISVGLVFALMALSSMAYSGYHLLRG